MPNKDALMESAVHYLQRELEHIVDKELGEAEDRINLDELTTFDDTLNALRRAAATGLENAAKAMREKTNG